MPNATLAILEKAVRTNAATRTFRVFPMSGDSSAISAMIPPIQTSLKKRWTKFMSTPNAGAKVEAAAWLTRARREIDQRQNHE